MLWGSPPFRDRRDAGERLAEVLARRNLDHPVVLGLPRGGVPVAAVIAKRLKAPLDVMLVRKLGAPRQAELAIGAIVDGAAPEIVRNEDLIEELGVSESYINAEAEQELAVIERRRQQWLMGRAFPDIAGKTVIVVDDGIATGATARAAVLALRRSGPDRIIVAVPVASSEAVRLLHRICDEVIALEVPQAFGSVGAFYGDFEQVEDEEVAAILQLNVPAGE